MPRYADLLAMSELSRRCALAFDMMRKCCLCPRKCGVNRLENEVGYCGIGKDVVISSYGPHYGEESVLVGYRGSGTIFFAGCNLTCVYCQNSDISQSRYGQAVPIARLTDAMLELQDRGCHNINLVTPSHVVPHILEGICRAAGRGLTLPIVYNSGGYDSVNTLRLLEGVVDIYMPDVKYLTSEHAQKYSHAPDYPEVVRTALVEMHRHVGDLELDSNRVAVKGVLVRHLVLPDGLSDTEQVLRFIIEEISPHTFINIMDQYRPSYQAQHHPGLRRKVTDDEYARALKFVQNLKAQVLRE